MGEAKIDNALSNTINKELIGFIFANELQSSASVSTANITNEEIRYVLTINITDSYCETLDVAVSTSNYKYEITGSFLSGSDKGTAWFNHRKNIGELNGIFVKNIGEYAELLNDYIKFRGFERTFEKGRIEL